MKISLLLCLWILPVVAHAEVEIYEGTLSRRARCADDGHYPAEKDMGCQHETSPQNKLCKIEITRGRLHGLAQVKIDVPELEAKKDGETNMTFKFEPQQIWPSLSISDKKRNSVEIEESNTGPKRFNIYLGNRTKTDARGKKVRTWIEYTCEKLQKLN